MARRVRRRRLLVNRNRLLRLVLGGGHRRVGHVDRGGSDDRSTHWSLVVRLINDRKAVIRDVAIVRSHLLGLLRGGGHALGSGGGLALLVLILGSSGSDRLDRGSDESGDRRNRRRRLLLRLRVLCRSEAVLTRGRIRLVR